MQNTAELPDLIFLDLNMPGCSGFDFLTQFERLYLSFLKPISIYIISSSVSENDRRKAFAYPFVRGFITKPVKKDKLEHLYASHQEKTVRPDSSNQFIMRTIVIPYLLISPVINH